MAEAIAGYLDGQRHYVVTRRPSPGSIWTYQIYKSRIEDYARRGDFCVVVVGDSLTPSQRLFAVPIAYLRERVFPRADMDDRHRYTFEVHKVTCEFTWRHGIHMDGRPFLVR